MPGTGVPEELEVSRCRDQFVDAWHHRVRVFEPHALVQAIAGPKVQGQPGDEAHAAEGETSDLEDFGIVVVAAFDDLPGSKVLKRGSRAVRPGCGGPGERLLVDVPLVP